MRARQTLRGKKTPDASPKPKASKDPSLSRKLPWSLVAEVQRKCQNMPRLFCTGRANKVYKSFKLHWCQLDVKGRRLECKQRNHKNHNLDGRSYEKIYQTHKQIHTKRTKTNYIYIFIAHTVLHNVP